MEKETKKSFKQVLKDIWSVLKMTGKFSYQLRSLILAIPVFVCAVCLAIRNAAMLPPSVGINILATGEYQWMVDRIIAVLGPLTVTVICLLLMACSKKILYPWLISVLSLALPVLLWIINMF